MNPHPDDLLKEIGVGLLVCMAFFAIMSVLNVMLSWGDNGWAKALLASSVFAAFIWGFVRWAENVRS